jgi:TctA family transporter
MQEVAMTVATGLLVLFNLFSGIFILPSEIPVFLQASTVEREPRQLRYFKSDVEFCHCCTAVARCGVSFSLGNKLAHVQRVRDTTIPAAV